MPIKDGALNCVAQRVIEHFEKAKRGYGLTSTRKQKIGIWEKTVITVLIYYNYSTLVITTTYEYTYVIT